jgi:hypothetical protein
MKQIGGMEGEVVMLKSRFDIGHQQFDRIFLHKTYKIRFAM